MRNANKDAGRIRRTIFTSLCDWTCSLLVDSLESNAIITGLFCCQPVQFPQQHCKGAAAGMRQTHYQVEIHVHGRKQFDSCLSIIRECVDFKERVPSPATFPCLATLVMSQPEDQPGQIEPASLENSVPSQSEAAVQLATASVGVSSGQEASEAVTAAMPAYANATEAQGTQQPLIHSRIFIHWYVYCCQIKRGQLTRSQRVRTLMTNHQIPPAAQTHRAPKVLPQQSLAQYKRLRPHIRHRLRRRINHQLHSLLLRHTSRLHLRQLQPLADTSPPRTLQHHQWRPHPARIVLAATSLPCSRVAPGRLPLPPVMTQSRPGRFFWAGFPAPQQRRSLWACSATLGQCRKPLSFAATAALVASAL